MVFFVYRDSAYEYRWRLFADNHKDILADSGQGYKRIYDCDHAIDVIQRDAHSARRVYASGIK